MHTIASKINPYIGENLCTGGKERIIKAKHDVFPNDPNMPNEDEKGTGRCRGNKPNVHEAQNPTGNAIDQ